MMSLNDLFAEQVRLHPQEARSHFEIVDPEVWQIVRAGPAKGSKKKGWVGPFFFCVDGVSYEAYARRDRCAESQRMFLEDWGVENLCSDGGGLPEASSAPTRQRTSSEILEADISATLHKLVKRVGDNVSKETATVQSEDVKSSSSFGKGNTSLSDKAEKHESRSRDGVENASRDNLNATAGSSLANMILRSAGIYSDEQLERIATGREANPGMGLAEAAVKFGGAKEIEFSPIANGSTLYW